MNFFDSNKTFPPLDNDSSIFMKIAQFANFIVNHNAADEESDFPVLTFLTGEYLEDRKKQPQTAGNGINVVGILESIPVKFEQVERFHSKSKKK